MSTALAGWLALAATGVRADDGSPRCFKVQSRGGTTEQICESPGFVTVESGPPNVGGAAVPTTTALRAHELKRWAYPDGVGPRPASGEAPRPSGWSGLRVGVGPWGVLSHAPGGLGVAGRISYDVAAEGPSPFVLGLMLDQTARPASAGAGDDTARAVTSLDVRVGYVVQGRVMPYVVAGLATSSLHVAPASGGSDIGVGVAYAIDDRWSLSFDYRHYSLRSTGSGTAPASLRATGTVGGDAFNALLLYRIL